MRGMLDAVGEPLCGSGWGTVPGASGAITVRSGLTGHPVRRRGFSAGAWNENLPRDSKPAADGSGIHGEGRKGAAAFGGDGFHNVSEGVFPPPHVEVMGYRGPRDSVAVSIFI